jgi:CelD/BcsL family acetyltransferase involved in cellulose biosynthesis
MHPGASSLLVRELSAEWVARAEQAWNGLIQAADAHPVFMGWAWTSSWVEALAAGRALSILGVFDGEQLVALLPALAARPAAALGGSRYSLGGVEETGADYSDLICARGFEQRVAGALAGWFLAEAPCVQYEFRDILPTALGRSVGQSLAADAIVDDRPGSRCPRASLSEGWDGLLRDRFERKRRYNIQRQLRLTEERDHCRLAFFDSPERIPMAFDRLVTLHNARKAAQGVDSAFSQGDRLGFHAKAAVRLAGSGAAFVATLESRGDVLAAAYCLRDSQSIYYFQSGLSAAGESIGAGSTLLFMLIRWAANRDYRWFDFLKGEEEYKKSWATDYVEQRCVTITRRTARGELVNAVTTGRRALGRLVHGITGAEGRG